MKLSFKSGVPPKNDIPLLKEVLSKGDFVKQDPELFREQLPGESQHIKTPNGF